MTETEKIFDKLDAMVQTQGDISSDIARIATRLDIIDERGSKASVKADKILDDKINKIKSKISYTQGALAVLTAAWAWLLQKKEGIIPWP